MPNSIHISTDPVQRHSRKDLCASFNSSRRMGDPSESKSPSAHPRDKFVNRSRSEGRRAGESGQGRQVSGGQSCAGIARLRKGPRSIPSARAPIVDRRFRRGERGAGAISGAAAADGGSPGSLIREGQEGYYFC